MRYRVQTDFPTEIVLQSGIDTSGENEPECEYEEIRGEAGAPTVLKVVSKKGALSLWEADTEELRFLKPEEFGDRLLYSRYLIKCIKGRETYG